MPDKKFSYIDIGSIDNTHQKLNQCENIIEPDNAPSRARKIVQRGDILYATVRPYLHNMCIVDKNFLYEPIASTGFAVLAVEHGIENVYLFYFMLSDSFDGYANKSENSKGVAYPAINDDKLYKALIPIPPLEEQARIVKRIEELFVQIDIIDQNQADIDTLYEEFRKRTLTLAIQGKLVPQNPNDEPASVLLERIRAEKKAKLGKKYVDSYIYKGDDNCYYEHIAGRAQDELIEVPFDIPYGWSWCRLAIFAQVLGGKRIPAGRQLTNENTGHYYIKVSDMKENTVCLDKLQFVPTDIYPTISRYIINKEDVYITVAGTIGRVGTIPNELDGANLTENADRIVVDEIDQHWFVKCLLSDVIQEQIKEATTKVGQPKLAIARIEKFLIPLPPLAEQKRIVAKINEIFAML